MLSKSIRVLALFSAAASTGLAGCGTTVGVNGQGQYATPVVRAPVTANPTPYSAALVCLAQYARANNRPSPVIAVGRIDDKTG